MRQVSLTWSPPVRPFCRLLLSLVVLSFAGPFVQLPGRSISIASTAWTKTITVSWTIVPNVITSTEHARRRGVDRCLCVSGHGSSRRLVWVFFCLLCLLFGFVLALHPCIDSSLSYKSGLVPSDMNSSHLRPFHKVCRQPQRLELAPVLDIRRARPFIEDLHCREFRYVDYN